MTTTTHETTTADNSDSAKAVVNTSPPVTIVARAVTVTAKAVQAPVQCKKGKKFCTGVAVLVSLKEATVLARTSLKVRAGDKVVLKLRKTAVGKKALRSLTRAQLQVGGKERTVRLRR